MCSNLPAANYIVQAIFAQSWASRSSTAWLFSLNQALHPTRRKEVHKSQEAKEISEAHETGDSQSHEGNCKSSKQLLVRGGSAGSSSLRDGRGTPGKWLSWATALVRGTETETWSGIYIFKDIFHFRNIKCSPVMVTDVRRGCSFIPGRPGSK